MKVGIIGAGLIARKAHIAAFKKFPDVHLISVSDINEDAAKTTAKRYGIPTFTTDYRNIIEDPSIELVSICTPPALHATMVIESAMQGKHILVEKPLALTVKDGKNIIKVINQNDIKLCVVHNYRYSPVLREIKKRIDYGRLGRIVSTYALCQLHPGGARKWLFNHGGALDEFGVHVLDLLPWLLNSPVEKVCAFWGRYPRTMQCINDVQILMKSKNQTVSIVNLSWLTATFMFLLEIHGTAGHAFADVQYNTFNEIHGYPTPLDKVRQFSSEMTNVCKDIITGNFFERAYKWHELLIRDFLESIRNGVRPPVTADEALRAVAILDAVKRSIATNAIINVCEAPSN